VQQRAAHAPCRPNAACIRFYAAIPSTLSDTHVEFVDLRKSEMCVPSQRKGVQTSAALRRASEGIAERRYGWHELRRNPAPRTSVGEAGPPPAFHCSSNGRRAAEATVAAAVRRALDGGQRNGDAVLMFQKLVGMWHGINATERARHACRSAPPCLSASALWACAEFVRLRGRCAASMLLVSE
jgi:hypothetical protein